MGLTSATCFAEPALPSTSLRWRRLETWVRPTRLAELTELYCDGQCARDLKGVNAKGNNKGWAPSKADPYHNSGTGDRGACCAEMDMWEANKVATAFTPHPATNPNLHVCIKDAECGSQDGNRFSAQLNVMVATSTLTKWVRPMDTVQASSFRSTPRGHSRLSLASMPHPLS